MNEVLAITLLSLKISLTAVFFASIISVLTAYLICFRNFYGKRFAINLVHTFMGLPPVVVGLVLYLILSRKGVLAPLNLLYTPSAMIAAQTIIAVPIITGISIDAITAVGKRITDTVVSLGATELQASLKILKEARHGITTAVIAGFGRAISEVGAIIIVGGNIRYYTRTLTTSIVLETGRGEFGLAMKLGIILILLSFFVNYALTVVSLRHENE